MNNGSNGAIRSATVDVDGLSIFYREAGEAGNPKLVLLHGFPSSSHQYRDLIPALPDDFTSSRWTIPGFGNSDMPDPATFPYTFDKTPRWSKTSSRRRGSPVSASTSRTTAGR